jgi:hypothetical protein
MIATATAVTAPPAGSRRMVGDDTTPLLQRIPADQLAQAVERALRELRASVAAEALPEMAVRLARHRMLGADTGRH